MEIILLDNIDNLGVVGDKVNVKNGFGRNFLLPRKLACLATPQNENYYRSLIEARRKKLAKAREGALAQSQELSDITLTFARRSQAEDSRLFGSVTTSDIAERLSELGYDIDRRRIALSEPIKRLGEFTATIKLHPEVSAAIPIVVRPEEEAQENAG